MIYLVNGKKGSFSECESAVASVSYPIFTDEAKLVGADIVFTDVGVSDIAFLNWIFMVILL